MVLQMKVIHIAQAGGPEVLQITKRERPQPQPGEVLIQVKAIGINRPDVLQRMGRYPAPVDAPADIPGLEVSGVIEKTGEQVDHLNVGDHICALVSGGGYAEYATAPAPQCLPVPEGLSFEEAASLPETFFTVWNNIFDIGKFKAGDTVLVHGGSSGIGVTAIQMIKALGGKVYITAGTTAKCQACEDLGADKAINYNKESFPQIIEELTSREGVDMVLDMVGGDYAAKNIQILKPKGRLIMINAMKGKMATVDLIRIMSKQLVVTGSTLRPQSVAYKGKIAQNLLETVWPLIPSAIKPVIFRSFPLEDAGKAHQLMESSAHIGKIVLVP
jgi:putative PIG3 family NAD(P)H quinone oxidoreductase